MGDHPVEGYNPWKTYLTQFQSSGSRYSCVMALDKAAMIATKVPYLNYT